MDEAKPAEIVEVEPTITREPAFQVLNKFLIDNHINLTFKYNQPRMIADGGVLIDPPSIQADYTD